MNQILKQREIEQIKRWLLEIGAQISLISDFIEKLEKLKNKFEKSQAHLIKKADKLNNA